MEQLLVELWRIGVYRAILIFVLVETILVTTQGIWLMIRAARRNRLERNVKNVEKGLGTRFIESLMEPDATRAWIEDARKHSPMAVRSFLEPRIRILAGDMRDAAILIYRELGFLNEDVRMSYSALWHRRMLAMRRLLFVASPAERQVLVARTGDHHSVALLAAQALAVVGTAQDVFSVLKMVDVPRRIMEQPVFILLNRMPVEEFRRLLTFFEEIPSESLRKILMVAAARRVPESGDLIFQRAVDSPAREIRIGAASAGAYLQSLDSIRLLMKLLEDPEPEVRAQAASSLGKRRSNEALYALYRAMEDRSFWVRQNAAAALGALGEEGRRLLVRLADTTSDPFAGDTARQELERIRYLQEAMGQVEEA